MDGGLYNAIAEFNTALRMIIRTVAKGFPSDPDVEQANRRSLVAIDIDPVIGIKLVGEYMYHFRDQILVRDETFFIANDYETQLRAGTDENQVTLVAKLIPKLKIFIRTLGPEERDDYWDIIIDMLRYYSIFRQHYRRPQ